MKKLASISVLETFAKVLGKPCMLISFHEDDGINIFEICKAAPYLNVTDDMQLLMEGGGILVFDSEEEMYSAFNQTVGDDGPTKTNPYTGKASVYALTCGADGRTQTENT